MIDWSRLTREETNVIRRIANRAHDVLKRNGCSVRTVYIEMDVSAAHIACPIDLEKLESAEDFTFMHDIGGIRRHIDRETGELKDCFVPRCAAGT